MHRANASFRAGVYPSMRFTLVSPRRRAGACALILSFGLPAARAQSVSPLRGDTLRLSLGEAVSIAMRQSDEVGIAAAQVDVATALYGTARASTLPQLRFTGVVRTRLRERTRPGRRIGVGAEARAPMARAVIGGLITSTLLTLFVVPAMYTYLDDFGHWVSSRLTSAADHDAASAMIPEPAAGD